MNADMPHGERRAVPRVTACCVTRVRCNNWSSIEVEVLDLSTRGMRIATRANVKTGQPVNVEILGLGLVAAKIAWRDGGEHGLSFDRPIDLHGCHWLPALTGEGLPAANPPVFRSADGAASLDG